MLLCVSELVFSVPTRNPGLHFYSPRVGRLHAFVEEEGEDEAKDEGGESLVKTIPCSLCHSAIPRMPSVIFSWSISRVSLGRGQAILLVLWL